MLALRYEAPSGVMLALTNLADEPCVIDLGDQLGDLPAAPTEVFGDGDYGDPRPDPAKLALNGYGYRWIRLHQSIGQRLRPVGVAPAMDWKLELVAVPVSDVDRAKAFYTEQAGFVADHDHQVNDELRFVQLTPPGSACSISIGTGIMDVEPGSVQGLQLVVSDIEAARAELVGRGVEVSEVQDFPWGRFVFFKDPDGNGWAVQEIQARS